MTTAMPLGQEFASLAARVLYGYLAFYPPFVPRDAGVEETSQAQMHAFLHEVIAQCQAAPSLIDAPEEADACFPSRWMLNKQNPALVDAIQAVRKRLFSFLNLLLRIGTDGTVRDDGLYIAQADWRIGARPLQKLQAFGVSATKDAHGVCLRCARYPAIAPAWKARSTRSAHATEWRYAFVKPLRFLFNSDPAQPYTATQAFGKLYDDPSQLRWMDTFFPAHGYGLENKPNELLVDRVRTYPDKDTGYARVSFRVRDRQQMSYEFRVPQFRRLLAFYEEMPPALQALCFARTNRCGGCGYCTQMDKTGTRKPFTLPLTYEGRTESKCPLWPGFVWSELDAQTMETMEALVRFAERKIYGIE